jgi:hypothetical protein
MMAQRASETRMAFTGVDFMRTSRMDLKFP